MEGEPQENLAEGGVMFARAGNDPGLRDPDSRRELPEGWVTPRERP